MNRFEEIGNYFLYLRNTYNLQICIKDFCGFIPINHELDEVLRPYLAHTNPFCMYIKSSRNSYYGCLSMIRKMYKKLQHDTSCFFGFCHCGLGEYVIPIVNNHVLLGTINMGFFQVNEEKTQNRICHTCNTYGELDAEKALSLYHQCITSSSIDINHVLNSMRLVAEYLSFTYDSVCKTHSPVDLGKRYYSSSEDTIISHAVEYIRQHYNQNICVQDISEFCHCSDSYVSRIFKKRTTININTYINKIRVEIAKEDLLHTKLPIFNIAYNVGFNDPNYFSRVFTDIIGIPPTEFRRRFYEGSQI